MHVKRAYVFLRTATEDWFEGEELVPQVSNMEDERTLWLSIVMEEIRRRPFKVCNSDRTRTIGMVLQSLEELKDRAGNKFGLTPTTCRVFLEKDGTEIDSEEYFSFLDDQTKLMVVSDGEEWMAGSQSKLLKTNLLYLVANHYFIQSNFVSTDLHSLKLLLFNMHY